MLTVVFGTTRLTPAHAASTLSMLGAAVSSLQHAEDLGAKYYYSNGTQGDPLQILKDNGVNYIRLRIWVNPANGYNNETKVLAFARQVNGTTRRSSTGVGWRIQRLRCLSRSEFVCIHVSEEGRGGDGKYCPRALSKYLGTTCT